MLNYRPAPLILLCLLSLPAVAAPPVVEAPKALQDVLTRYLKLEEPRDGAERDALAHRLEIEGADLLSTEGYFNPDFTLEGPLDQLTLKVNPGPRAEVVAVDIRIEGPVPEERRQALIQAWSLKQGQTFRQADWDKAKENLLLDLLAKDFAAAHLRDSQALVDADHNRVSLQVQVESGAPYRFGELKIDGLLRYSPELVDRYNQGVEAGDEYQETRLHTLQTGLENTPYFNSVFIELDRENAVPGPDGSLIAPVQVQLRERQPHQLSFGAGVSSNTGARVETTFRTADLLHRAWQLNSGLRLEQLRQTAYADVFLPPTKAGYQDAFGWAVENSNIQNLKLHSTALGISRQHQRGNLDITLGLNWQVERQSPQGGETTHSRATTLNSIWIWRPFKDKEELDEGYSTQIQVGGAFEPLSDQNFLRLYGRHQQAFALTPHNTLSLRAEGGITLADSRQGIPQDFLFRAGGTNSVRGYSYQGLGVKDGAAIVGGRYLATLSAELTHWIADSPWGVATFVDAGNAGDDKNAFKLKLGYGLGARWRSPAGPLGVDLAYGQATHDWHLHFALAIPF